jgi:hypothetical protein
MTVVLFPSNPSGAATNPSSDDHTEVFIHLHARIVTHAWARRKVNGWLCMEVGDRMLAGEPELLVGERLIWRVPVQWTSPTTGALAQFVDQILVDAVSGELLIDPSTAQELEQRVVALAHSLRTAAS